MRHLRRENRFSESFPLSGRSHLQELLPDCQRRLHNDRRKADAGGVETPLHSEYGSAGKHSERIRKRFLIPSRESDTREKWTMEMYAHPHPLGDYLDKHFTCDCGKEHYASLKFVSVRKDALEDLPVFAKELGFKSLYLISDNITRGIAGDRWRNPYQYARRLRFGRRRWHGRYQRYDALFQFPRGPPVLYRRHRRAYGRVRVQPCGAEHQPPENQH